jgi:MtN3 and saliva related transmembrane protein
MNWITIIGLIAATLTTVSFLPQMIKTIREKHTKDISLSMYIIFTTGVAMWLVYGLIKTDWPIILANIFTLSFASVILVMKIRYK